MILSYFELGMLLLNILIGLVTLPFLFNINSQFKDYKINDALQSIVTLISYKANILTSDALSLEPGSREIKSFVLPQSIYSYPYQLIFRDMGDFVEVSGLVEELNIKKKSFILKGPCKIVLEEEGEEKTSFVIDSKDIYRFQLELYKESGCVIKVYPNR